MKCLLLAAALVCLASSANAEPSSSVIAEPPPPPLTSYVQLGVTTGIAYPAAFGGAAVELGFRLDDDSPLWFHTMAAAGTVEGLDEPTTESGLLFLLRGGIEARGCVLDGVVCFVGGADLGYRHMRMVAEFDRVHVDDLALSPRVGLDVGIRHLRFRPGAELSVGWEGIDLAISGGFAYAF